MIRRPVAADKYYAASATQLLAQLTECLAQPAPHVFLPASPTPTARISSGQLLRGVIVPHGALQDSGRVAAAAYSLLDQAEEGRLQPLRAILLGTNHFILQPPACLSTAASWAIPLGNLTVDQELNQELQSAGLPYDDQPHRVEHSIENQLPFLQYVAAAQPGGPSCSIAPVSIGWLGGVEGVEAVAEAVVAALGRHPPGSVLLIATSDFTHAGPSYGESPAAPWMTLREHAIWRDSPLLHAIVSGDPGAFLDCCSAVGTSLCGRWPVAVFLRVAQILGWDLQLLTYAPSDLYVQSGNINGFASFSAWDSRQGID